MVIQALWLLELHIKAITVATRYGNMDNMDSEGSLKDSIVAYQGSLGLVSFRVVPIGLGCYSVLLMRTGMPD